MPWDVTTTGTTVMSALQERAAAQEAQQKEAKESKEHQEIMRKYGR